MSDVRREVTITMLPDQQTMLRKIAFERGEKLASRMLINALEQWADNNGLEPLEIGDGQPIGLIHLRLSAKALAAYNILIERFFKELGL